MDIYKYQQRRKKRGLHCCFGIIDQDGVPRGRLCGCGFRDEPSKKHKARIVKRTLKEDFQREISEFLIDR
jgi:hypothetical protein